MALEVPICRRGAVDAATLEYEERDDGLCEVVVSYGAVRYGAVEDTLFDALLSVRAKLEEHGILIAVRGASVDVWPSPMALDMGPAQFAYRMTMGKSALQTDLVDIFEVAEDVVPATIAAQTEYREAWFKSLGLAGGADT